MATIITKNSSTASSVPLAAQLVQGELAVNVADKRLFTEDSGGTVVEVGTNPSSLTLASGTANGVAFLSGSKVVTSGTALAFDGTNLTATNGASIQGLTVGRGAGSVATNTAVGASALAANTSGDTNTATGYQALTTNTSGTSNTAYGVQALRFNTTGGSNASFGRGSLNSNTTGGSNVAIGENALTSNTTASNNTAVGYQAGYSNTTGVNNTIVGFQAGYSLTSGSYNVFVGPTTVGTVGACGALITTGSKNSILGGYNGNQGGLDIRTSSNNIVLSDGDGNPALWYDGAGTWNNRGTGVGSCGGYNMRDSNNTKYWSMAANSSNWYLFDADSSHYPYFPQNGTAWGFGSDARIKTDITEINYGLATVLAMKPRRYRFKASGKIDIGFIAQELRDVVPEAVFGEEIEFSDADTPQERASKTLGIGKELLIPILVKAIQELKAEFDAYKEAHP